MSFQPRQSPPGTRGHTPPLLSASLPPEPGLSGANTRLPQVVHSCVSGKGAFKEAEATTRRSLVRVVRGSGRNNMFPGDTGGHGRSLSPPLVALSPHLGGQTVPPTRSTQALHAASRYLCFLHQGSGGHFLFVLCVCIFSKTENQICGLVHTGKSFTTELCPQSSYVSEMSLWRNHTHAHTCMHTHTHRETHASEETSHSKDSRARGIN